MFDAPLTLPGWLLAVTVLGWITNFAVVGFLFRNTKCRGSGIAVGMHSLSDSEKILSLTAERKDWKRVSSEVFPSRHSAITYLDPEGFRFYTPALMTMFIIHGDEQRMHCHVATCHNRVLSGAGSRFTLACGKNPAEFSAGHCYNFQQRPTQGRLISTFTSTGVGACRYPHLKKRTRASLFNPSQRRGSPQVQRLSSVNPSSGNGCAVSLRPHPACPDR